MSQSEIFGKSYLASKKRDLAKEKQLEAKRKKQNTVASTRKNRRIPPVNIGGIFLPGRDAVKPVEVEETLPLILHWTYTAFNRLGSKFTYSDLYNYFSRHIVIDPCVYPTEELQLEAWDREWRFQEKLVYALKNTYIEFENKETKERIKRSNRKTR
jgi:hypothetical protein